MTPPAVEDDGAMIVDSESGSNRKAGQDVTIPDRTHVEHTRHVVHPRRARRNKVGLGSRNQVIKTVTIALGVRDAVHNTCVTDLSIRTLDRDAINIEVEQLHNGCRATKGEIAASSYTHYGRRTNHVQCLAPDRSWQSQPAGTWTPRQGASANGDEAIDGRVVGDLRTDGAMVGCARRRE